MLLLSKIVINLKRNYFIGHFYLLAFFTVIMSHSTIAESQSGKTNSAEELINNIIASERQIKDVQLHMTCTIPDANNKVFFDFDWGYEGGKEFYTGQKHLLNKPEFSDIPTVYTVTKTFDGEKSYMLRIDPREGAYPSGMISSINPDEFRAIVTPTSLLGFDAKTMSRQSLGEAIAEAESVAVREELEKIDGHSCQVIEAVNVEVDPSTKESYDVRAWIDTERGFRPLKFEKCRHVVGPNKWKVIFRSVYNIKLKQIDGIWFPVEGDRTTFSIRKVWPPEGMTQEQFDALSIEERRQVGVFTFEPMVPTRRLEIQADSIRINKGIQPERFKIKFPVGCRLWDEYTQMGYIVGGGDKLLLESVTLDDNTKKHPSTPEDDRVGITNAAQPRAQSNKQGSENTASRRNDVDRQLRQPENTRYLTLLIAILLVFVIGIFFFKIARVKK